MYNIYIPNRAKPTRNSQQKLTIVDLGPQQKTNHKKIYKKKQTVGPHNFIFVTKIISNKSNATVLFSLLKDKKK